MNSKSDNLLQQEIESFKQKYPDIREIEVIAVNISGHFFGKRYPITKLESFARDGLAFPMSTFVLGNLGESLDNIIYGNDDGDPDAHFYLIPGSLCLNAWGNRPRAQMMATSFKIGRASCRERV